MKVNMFIDHRDVEADQYTEVKDPGNLSEIVSLVAKGNTNHVDQAVKAAHRAFLSWRNVTLEERISLLLKAAEAVVESKSEIALATSKENGMLFTRTRDEVMMGVTDLRNLADLAGIAFTPRVMEDETGWVKVVKKPMGVVACIVPWNAPLVLTMQKIAPVLIAVNTVVVKPSPTATGGVAALLKCIGALLPAGVVNVVFGDGDVGTALTTHPLVRKISFTGGGSTAVAVMKSAAESLKGIHFELGGNDPAIILDDVIIDEAAPKIVEAALRRSGQFCFAIKRTYVPESMYEVFYKKVCELADAYKIGHQLNEEATMGPMNNELQYRRVSDLIKRMEESGANMVKLGQKLEPDKWDNGYYLQPVVVRDLDPRAEIVACEQFGPIIPLVSYRSEKELIEMVNDSEYGLGSSIWSSDENRAIEMASKIEAGMTFINGHGQTSLGSKYMPFGGIKMSGIGREKSIEVFDEFIEYHGINLHKKRS